MKSTTLHENNASTIEWKTFALGTTLKAGGTDFTASGTTQTFTLDQLEAGDIARCGLARGAVANPISHAANWSLQVGITGDTDRLIANTELKALSLNGDTVVPTVAADALPYVRANGNPIDIVALLTVGSGNVSDTTAGEVWITIPIIRRADRVTRRGSF